MAAVEVDLDREDIVLLILEANERLLRKDSLNGITRLEKLIFLLEEETSFEGIAKFFPFVPYDFGPFSKEVCEAVDFLESCNLIVVSEKTYGSAYAASNEETLFSEISDENRTASSVQVREKCFSLTDDGRKVTTIIRKAISQKNNSDLEAIDMIVLKYGTRPLNHLIRYVYRQYPDMASNSIHPEAKKLT